MSQHINKILFIAFLIVAGCGYDNTALQAQEGSSSGGGNGSTSALDFAKIKADIIQKSCSGCHTGGGARGGVTLDTYEATKAKLTIIWSAVSRGQMPPSGPLPSTVIAELKQWIDEGAIESAGSTPVPEPVPVPEPRPGPPIENVDFALIQKEIFSTKCAGCHTEGGARGGVVLDTYSTVKPKIKSIWKEVSKGDMPLAGPLDPALVSLLKRWVDAGAPEKVSPLISMPQVECTLEYRDKLSDGRFVDIDGTVLFDVLDQTLKLQPQGCEL